MPATSRPTRHPWVGLDDLAALAGSETRRPGGPDRAAPPDDKAVHGVTNDSGRVQPGDLFAALPGARTHGARYARSALESGAVAVLTDPDGAAGCADLGVPVLVHPDPRGVLGAVAARVYDDPTAKLAVLGITGTNGKTTTCYLVEAALAAVGVPAGLIGTVESRMATADGLVAVPSARTTPEAPDLQAGFALMAEAGVRAVAIEVSSHALALGRVDGTRFAAAGFTNLSQDHLDFHGDLESYFAAKARLFDGRAEHQVVCVDDEWGVRLAASSGRPVTTVTARSDRDAAWSARDVVQAAGRVQFTAVGPGGVGLPVDLALPGHYNVANALVALAVLSAVLADPGWELAFDLSAAAAGLAMARVPGRMEVVSAAGSELTAVVDYAHSPDAVAALLAALRPMTPGRVILVLGCGGDRDSGKRPAMGRVAAAGADVLIITDDNPRTEDSQLIRAAMRAGADSVTGGAQLVEVGLRREAIAEAVHRAGPGDTVVVAGKGHEQGQEVDGVVLPFDDRDVLRAALSGVGR